MFFGKVDCILSVIRNRIWLYLDGSRAFLEFALYITLALDTLMCLTKSALLSEPLMPITTGTIDFRGI